MERETTAGREAEGKSDRNLDHLMKSEIDNDKKRWKKRGGEEKKTHITILI